MKNRTHDRPASIQISMPGFTAFAGHRCLGCGPLSHVARKAKKAVDSGEGGPVQVFDDRTGEFVEIDFRGTTEQVVERLSRLDTDALPASSSPPRGPGRPKLGVIAREVTLLPGQWDWLDGQPGGASAALRRLIYEARRSDEGKQAARRAQDAVYRFMTTMAGNFPGFEEALRAFYRREHRRFNELIRAWPQDVRRHIKRLVSAANHSDRRSETKTTGSRGLA
ncbi:MAG TPA: DUF2239 family protein [Verrucomicrobiae bacterium]|nr:DUF2239 family protein [Verrucomicrobiae bacterium]